MRRIIRKLGKARYQTFEMLGGRARAHFLDADRVDEWLAVVERQISLAEKQAGRIS